MSRTGLWAGLSWGGTYPDRPVNQNYRPGPRSHKTRQRKATQRPPGLLADRVGGRLAGRRTKAAPAPCEHKLGGQSPPLPPTGLSLQAGTACRRRRPQCTTPVDLTGAMSTAFRGRGGCRHPRAWDAEPQTRHSRSGQGRSGQHRRHGRFVPVAPPERSFFELVPKAGAAEDEDKTEDRHAGESVRPSLPGS